MTKDRRRASKWTNLEIEDDSAGYIEAQRAEREDAAEAERRAAERRDRKDYTRSYVAAGGDPEDADEAYRAWRHEQAAAATAEASESMDERARRELFHETLRKL